MESVLQDVTVSLPSSTIDGVANRRRRGGKRRRRKKRRKEKGWNTREWRMGRGWGQRRNDTVPF